MAGGCGESMQEIIERRTEQERRLMKIEIEQVKQREKVAEVLALATKTAQTVDKAGRNLNKLVLLALVVLVTGSLEKAGELVKLLQLFLGK